MSKKNEYEQCKELALKFLVCCYFGRSEDLLSAAIDRAYVDMASHTLEGFKSDNQKKWNCRFNASNNIYKEVKNYASTDYNQWHSDTVNLIKGCYTNPALTEGQAQKWLNMTVKYLFALKNLLGISYLGLADAKVFLEKTKVKDYWVPIDSYVLKGSGNTGFEPWSGMDDGNYSALKEIMDSNNQDFIWELTNWESYRSEFGGKPVKGSYVRHLLNNELKYGS